MKVSTLRKTFLALGVCLMAVRDHHRNLGKITVLMGDITALDVDANVNAANNSLLGGGGVDGAIHHAAGPQLLEECRSLGGCPTGEARITRGYRLSAKWVIHTVGPVWRGGGFGEDELLARCYKSCFDLVEEHGLKSVAFPSISTGAYGFPAERAARIAVLEMNTFLEKNSSIQVIAVCFNKRVYDCYIDALE
jgi:O-acetyl-ADP-ribose deacetylase (regulator of RNase III)